MNALDRRPKTVERKHKVPLAYSRADDGARSLNGRLDDEFEKEYADTKNRFSGDLLLTVLLLTKE